jgi:hypothetical protein
MNQFLQMNIFFFITTVVVVISGVLLVAILYRIWHILGNVERISKDVSEESALLRDDLHEMRRRMKDGFSIVALGVFLNKALKRFTGRSGKRQKSGGETV